MVTVASRVQVLQPQPSVILRARLELAGYRIVLHVHDEAIAEVPIGFGSTEEFTPFF